jgi:hypothetical protein
MCSEVDQIGQAEFGGGLARAAGQPSGPPAPPATSSPSMAKTDRVCPACGKHALSIATRCPGCGQEFPTQPLRWQASPDTRRRPPLPAVIVILLLAVGLFTLVMRRSTARGLEVGVSGPVRAESPIALDSARAAATPVMPDSAPSAGAVRRHTRTWTKVHDRRSTKADVVAVLLPGDSVLADSLRGGWWRVALDGRVIGYVHAGTLLGD